MIFEGELIFDCLDDSGTAMSVIVNDKKRWPRDIWVEFHSAFTEEFWKTFPTELIPDELTRADHPELNDLVGKTLRVTVEVIE